MVFGRGTLLLVLRGSNGEAREAHGLSSVRGEDLPYASSRGTLIYRNEIISKQNVITYPTALCRVVPLNPRIAGEQGEIILFGNGEKYERWSKVACGIFSIVMGPLRRPTGKVGLRSFGGGFPLSYKAARHGSGFCSKWLRFNFRNFHTITIEGDRYRTRPDQGPSYGVNRERERELEKDGTSFSLEESIVVEPQLSIGINWFDSKKRGEVFRMFEELSSSKGATSAEMAILIIIPRGLTHVSGSRSFSLECDGK